MGGWVCVAPQTCDPRNFSMMKTGLHKTTPDKFPSLLQYLPWNKGDTISELFP